MLPLPLPPSLRPFLTLGAMALWEAAGRRTAERYMSSSPSTPWPAGTFFLFLSSLPLPGVGETQRVRAAGVLAVRGQQAFCARAAGAVSSTGTGSHGGVGLTVGLDDLSGLFLSDSMIWWPVPQQWSAPLGLWAISMAQRRQPGEAESSPQWDRRVYPRSVHSR